MKEKLEQQYADFKNVLDVLPTNNKFNRQKKLDYILEETKKNSELIENIKQEINRRLSVFENLQVNPNIDELEKKLEQCSIINEWNQYNTPYEKMHLDYYLYQLHRYYKEDLTSVNTCINKIIESFNKVGITLTKEDFDFNNYISEYIDKILKKESPEILKTSFEETYWKFPEIIKTIEINFKSIYLRNEKKIIKYYEDRHEEFLKNHNDAEIYDMHIRLTNEITNLKSKDQYLIFEKFKSNEYTLGEYSESDINKLKEQYFPNNSYNHQSLLNLNQTLFEYNLIIKYNYLLTDMKDRLEKKDTLKGSKDNAIKEIQKEESKLKKLNNQRFAKTLPFLKKRNDEKWLFDYKNALTSITAKYDEFDNSCFNDLIFKKLSQDSTVLEVLKLISSNYIYFVTKTKQLDENANINDITKQYNILKDEVNNHNYTLLNNIALLDEKQMKQIIVDKYNLENIEITIDSLEKDNIEKTIDNLEKLINYENIISSGIKLEDIKLYLEYQKVI